MKIGKKIIRIYAAGCSNCGRPGPLAHTRSKAKRAAIKAGWQSVLWPRKTLCPKCQTKPE